MDKRCASVLLMLHKEAKHDFFPYFNAVIKEELEKLGILVDTADLSETQDMWSHIAAKIIKGEYDAALVLNSWGEQDILLDSGESLFDRAGLPGFNWIVDHPAEHNSHLETICRNYHCICIDRDHIRFLKKYYPDIAGVDFLPLPVRDDGADIDTIEQFANRQKDVVFVGNCPDPAYMRSVFERCPEEQRELLHFLSEHLLTHRELSYEAALEEILLAVFEREVTPEEMREYVKLTASVISYIRFTVREEIIRNLMSSEVKLHLYGTGWERYQEELKNGNTVFHGSAAFQDLSGIYRDAKIVLNIMPWFRNGIHDRITAGMYAGAAVATDHSGYLDELQITGGKDTLVFFDIQKPQELPEILMNALEDPNGLAVRAQYGRQLADRKLSASQIVRRLVEILSQ